MSLSLLLASLLTVSSSTGNICSASVTEIGPIRPTTDDVIRIRVQGREGVQVLLTIPARFASGSIPVMLGRD